MPVNARVVQPHQRRCAARSDRRGRVHVRAIHCLELVVLESLEERLVALVFELVERPVRPATLLLSSASP
jgi:hypothetical protein